MNKRLKITLLVMAALLCGAFVQNKLSNGSYRTGLGLTLDLSFVTNSSLETILTISRENALTLQNTTEDFVKEVREKYTRILGPDVTSVNTTLNPEEERRLAECVVNGPRDRKENGSKFWPVEGIRRTHHRYLKRTGAVLMEIGGNKGQDAGEFVRLYNPRYIILEPIEQYYTILKTKFKHNPRVTVINLGLGKKNEVSLVAIEGNNAAATSRFSKTRIGGNRKHVVPLYITDAVGLLTNLGVGVFEVDLITFNCEGCEFEALEVLLSSSLATYLKNIQFATHSTLPMLNDPIPRYCKIQELLARTHRPTYQFRFIWESWRRKDL